ncbi:MAG TPA: glycosyltransferase family 4 protein [Candidatus Wujingus californicus]|uniref:glycosyltransferase family 4 protein n=1 Tax=Candidatus Wujingus californicus TaxID=3367618 RepID=UPI001D73188A|nr:glycosyltransferase family 4 protein [Planctomycetota bacterium]MDO8131460.1 glycosyltransferase family 4 protein [Candidatus Brocadiales bacterium]
MKIALVVFQFIREKGGVEGYAYSLSKQLLRLGHEVHLFAHRYSRSTSSIALDINNELTFHRVPAITFWSPLKYWTFAINAPRIINKSGIRFDIVHGLTHTLFQDIYRVGGGCHWDYMMHTYPIMRFPLGRIFMCLNPRHFSILLLERLIFKKRLYRQVTCISEQCKEEIVQHYGLSVNDIEIIYNCIDTEIFTPQNKLKYRTSTRVKYNIEDDAILLIFVGSGFKRKGLRHIIDTLSLIDRGKNMKLLIAGNGNVRFYQRLAKEKGVSDRIIFAGVSREIHEIYAAGDIFVFPSEYDAFGTACLEAMASGLPVIVSSASGASEIISHGKDGFVINHPINSVEIANFINILLEKEVREQMGNAARHTSEIYSIDANVKRILRIYQKVLALKS